jgi:hypothetical protein
MDNPEKLARLGTQDTGQRQTEQKTQKTKKDEPHGPHQKQGVNPCTHEGYTVLASYTNCQYYKYIPQVSR